MALLSRRLLLGALAASVLPSAGRAQPGGIGAVLLHGKRDSSWGSLSTLNSALSGAGVVVAAPDLPWSSSRYLSGNWSSAIDEIAGSVQSLRSRGVGRIVLVGHSMGCPAAMAYAAQRGGVAGLVLTAPGHTPAGFYNISPPVRASIDEARAMVRAGRGGEIAEFADNNQGSIFPVRTSAAAYLSYFDPNGPCEMRNTAGRVACPALWVVGTNDQVIQWGDGIGRQVTRRPKSRMLVIPGANHRSTPSAAAGEIVAWVTSL